MSGGAPHGRAAMNAALAIVALACAGGEPLRGDVVRVLNVYDGDTIEVEYQGRTEHVRYIGIDAPEMTDPRRAVRETAHAAAAANRRLVGGRRVRLEFDVQQRDQYGRLLAYVHVGDTLVNEWLVHEGFARAGSYPPNLRRQEALRAAERAARAAERRLWDGRLAGGPVRLPDDGAAPDAPDAPDAADLGFEAGERRTVCDLVASTRRLDSGPRLTFLNLGRPYPNQTLVVVIEPERRDAFSEPPERRYEGQRICVTGVVTFHRGDAQIVVRGPGQIELEEP